MLRFRRADRLGPSHRVAALVLAAMPIVVPAVSTAFAQVPKPAPAPVQPLPVAKPAAPPSPAVIDAAKLAFEALPLPERTEIQDGLVWTGDYTGALDGAFGRMTFDSLTAFQARHAFGVDGILTAPARKVLADVAKQKKAEVGFAAVDDKATGVRIQLPLKLLGPATPTPDGSRWSARDGRIAIETHAIADGDLAKLFETMKADVPGRKVVYAVLRPDWFVVSDEAGGRHGYARFARGASGVRGFVFRHDASLGPAFDRVVIATAGRFEPFPGAAGAPPATPQATGPTTPGQPAAPGQAAAPTPPAPPGPANPAPGTAALPPATGLVVAAGKVVTTAQVVGNCKSVSVGGAAASVTVADADGYATLAVAGSTAPGALRLGDRGRGPFTVVFRGEDAGRPALQAVAAEASAAGIVAALQRGGQGGAVVDATGGLVALVVGRPDEKRAVAGLVPSASYAIGTGEGLTAAIGAAGGSTAPADPAAQAKTTGRSVGEWGPRLVSVLCKR